MAAAKRRTVGSLTSDWRDNSPSVMSTARVGSARIFSATRRSDFRKAGRLRAITSSRLSSISVVVNLSMRPASGRGDPQRLTDPGLQDDRLRGVARCGVDRPLAQGVEGEHTEVMGKQIGAVGGPG